MQKVKKLVLQIVIAALAVVPAGFGALVLSAQTAGAVDCAVLPSDICASADNTGKTASDNGVFAILKWVLKILTALVGIAAVGGMIWAGILYTSASDDANQVKQSKTIIVDIIIGLVAYGLMFVALNWIVPGGVLN